jgi:hypothetical protein
LELGLQGKAMRKLRKQKSKRTVPPLKIYRETREDEQDDGGPPPDGRPPFLDSEDYWAGRNLAMRRSARVAA